MHHQITMFNPQVILQNSTTMNTIVIVYWVKTLVSFRLILLHEYHEIILHNQQKSTTNTDINIQSM